MASARAKRNYIKSAKEVLKRLESDEDFLKHFLYGYHKMGIKYFDPRSMDGYVSIIGSREHPDIGRNYTEAELDHEAKTRIVFPDPNGDHEDDITDWFDSIQVVNKQEFLQEVEDNGGEPTDEISIDDVHRHDVILDVITNEISEVDNKDKDGKFTDRILTWERLDDFVMAHPDGNKIVIHGEGDTTFFYLPIPTLTEEEKESLKNVGGRRKSIKRRHKYRKSVKKSRER